jgi:4-alpha-glucanotransferase
VNTDRHWAKIGLRPHHGVLVPLFALHTKNRGAASFLDLIPLIDWCKQIGFDTLDLLPIYDTGDDLSPYNPISSCALDPTYLDLPIASFGTRSETKGQKLAYLKSRFTKLSSEESLFLQNNPWLSDYGHHLGDLPFHVHVQALCFAQMLQVKQHAERQGILLKGDLPLFMARHSVDVATYPELFQQELAAGAPPDSFNPEGQAWGFPPYNWDAMKSQDYFWWKRRLKTMAKWCHIYRIDHVVGLFRTWVGDRFDPEEPSIWMEHGKEILEMMIDASSALPVAEDLGTIPDEVYPILRQLRLCGIKIFGLNLDLPYDQFSLTTVSTPDTEPLQIWWEKYPEESARFAEKHHWAHPPQLPRDLRLKILHAAHRTDSLFHINLLEEYLDLFCELSWSDPGTDRINIPGTISSSNWSYRFRPSLEEIVSHKALGETLRSFL